jgi:hypothetical protein
VLDADIDGRRRMQGCYAGLTLQRSGFNSRPDYVRFMVEKVVMGQDFAY